MITESYEYTDFEDSTHYLFASEGQKGTIIKVVIFTFVEDNFWNLGFGDLNKGQIDGSVVSNNYDIVKLIGTIAKIAYEFSDKFPSRGIRIQPVDEKRKNLYNHVFRRHYTIINTTFYVSGYVNGQKEVYSPEKTYDIFELKRRFV
jgi:hypothetical protein